MNAPGTLARSLRALVPALLLPGLGACSFLVRHAQDELEAAALTAIEVTVPAPGACRQQTVDALGALSERPSTAVDPARLANELPLRITPEVRDALEFVSGSRSPTGQVPELRKFIEAAAPVRRKGNAFVAVDETEVVHFSRARLRREIDGVARAAQGGAFAQIAAARAPLAATRELTVDEKRLFDHAEFLARYFEHYFRHGRLLAIGLDRKDAAARLQKDLAHAMGREYGALESGPKAAVDDAVLRLLDKVCSGDACPLLNLADTETAFVSRAGQKFGFPVVKLDVAPGTPRGIEVTKIDEIAIIGDLTRVALEATFDSLRPDVPAIGTATGCLDKPPLRKLFATCQTTADDRLAAVNKAGDYAEAVGGYFAAQVVRGAWLASLNNEALAKFIDTLISVAARKLAEAAMWDAMACGNDPRTLRMRKISYVADP